MPFFDDAVPVNIFVVGFYYIQVGLVTMGEGGKVQVGIKAFGEDKPNFNPSLQETGDLDERIEGSSTAPKHAGYRL